MNFRIFQNGTIQSRSVAVYTLRIVEHGFFYKSIMFDLKKSLTLCNISYKSKFNKGAFCLIGNLVEFENGPAAVTEDETRILPLLFIKKCGKARGVG
jgi:hypothetical protein